jgi:DNA recombination protein RmuC
MEQTVQSLYLIAVVFLAAIVLLVVLAVRRPVQVAGDLGEAGERLREVEAEASALRQSKADLERGLAVEQQKSSRLIEVERDLGERTQHIEVLREDKAAAENELAAAKEALLRVEASRLEERARLTTTEQSLEASRIGNRKVEEALARKTEAVDRVESAVGELRTRLAASEQARELVSTRLETAAQEKSELEAGLSQNAAILAGKSETVANLNHELGKTRVELDTAKNELSDRNSSLARLQETLEQERKNTGEKLDLLAESKERMTQEFKILASDVVKEHGETFTKQNREQIDTILAPLRDKLGEFQQGLQTAHTESTKERATLTEQIRQLSERSATMTLETSNLTRALKGESQTQGAWGEMILGSILERSGLRVGEEYVIQQTQTNEDGARLRPDAVVNLPEGRRIVIDSKLSLVAFERYINAETDSERAEDLISHLSSMRTHIKTLSRKEYHSAMGSDLDYVVMFIPIEGALSAALQKEPSLTAFAVENNVAIATPTTLMIALRTAASVWQVERRNRNAEAISERAGKIYDKLVGFVEDMRVLGDRLNQARHSFDEGIGKLSSGRGNLMNQVQQLKGLGARTSKSLPEDLIDSSEPDAPLEREIAGVLT